MFAPHLNSLPGSFRVGPLRFPVFGVFATAGLLTALGLSQRTARRAGLAPQTLWDAGVLAIVAAFIVSRLLLVAENFRVFRLAPLLVLALPSLTYTGMFLTALLVWLYLRLKRVPVLRALDAWAPCASLLATFLDLGHFFEGTGAGMPTSLPWGVISPEDTVLGRTHPVQIYAMLAALALLAFLWPRLGQRPLGETAALALLLGGLADFLLDFLRQPALTELPLDPAQLAALLAMIAGGLLLVVGRQSPKSCQDVEACANRPIH